LYENLPLLVESTPVDVDTLKTYCTNANTYSDVEHCSK